MSPGLAHGAGLARTANVEVAGLEGARAIGNLDGTLPIVSFVTDVSKPFFAIIGAKARYPVDDLDVEARRLLFSDDAKVLLGEIKRLDNCVAPDGPEDQTSVGGDGMIDLLRKKATVAYQFCTNSRKASRGFQFV
jgi:hypothetical protein